MNEPISLTNLDARLTDVATYLEELRSTLRSHDSAFDNARFAELEERIAPTSPSMPGVAVGAITGSLSSQGADAFGKVSLYADVANSLADPTFETIPNSSPITLTSAWQRLSRYWEARLIVDSGTNPVSAQIYRTQERTTYGNDYTSANLAVDLVNQSGSTITGQVTIELSSRRVAYPLYAPVPPHMTGSVRSKTSVYRHASLVSSVSVALGNSYPMDSETNLVESAWEDITYDPPSGAARAERIQVSSNPITHPTSTFREWYLVARVRMAYTSVPHNTRIGLAYLSEPQLVATWSPDAPPYSPNLGKWHPPLADGTAPYAYPIGFPANATSPGSLTLAYGGGCVAVPIHVPARMLVQQVSIWNTDTTSARAWNWAIYDLEEVEGRPGSANYPRILYGSAVEAFTAGAASKRTITVSGTQRSLYPGVYWLVIQNCHTANSFGIGAFATGTLVHNRCMTVTRAMMWATQIADWTGSGAYIARGWWRLGELSGTTAADSGTLAHPGTYVGAPALGLRGIVDDENTSVGFNGSTQYVTTSSVPWTGLDEWSLSAVVRPASYPPGDFAMIAHNGTDANGYGLAITETGELRGLLGSVGWITTGRILDIGTRYFVGINRTAGVTTMRLGGSDVTTGGPYSDTPNTPTTRLSIGAQDNGSGTFQRFFHGTIDEVAVWNPALYTSAWGRLGTASQRYANMTGWTKNSGIPLVVVEGSSFGEGSVF